MPNARLPLNIAVMNPSAPTPPLNPASDSEIVLRASELVSQCVHCFVGMGDGGIGDALMLELNSVG